MTACKQNINIHVRNKEIDTILCVDQLPSKHNSTVRKYPILILAQISLVQIKEANPISTVLMAIQCKKH